jgi:hypothetical protein
MPQVRFERTIPVLEQAKTVHALDRAATVCWTVNSVAQKSEQNLYERDYGNASVTNWGHLNVFQATVG